MSMKRTRSALLAGLVCAFGFSAAPSFAVPIAGINGYNFDLAQFAGAFVTYRASPPGTVTFDGKLWDNANGVDGFSLGELASGQFGSDPGDQVSLNNRTTPDWLQLDYSFPITISPTAHELVIFEITSDASNVDVEGTSFRVRFNGGTLYDASLATLIDHYPNTGAEEDTNMLVFDLYNFGFVDGNMFSTLYIENFDSGSSTSDPDFIFAGMAGQLASTAVPEPNSLFLLALGLMGVLGQRMRSRV